MSTAIITGVLVAGGTWMILNRGGVRTVIGFVLLGHAANVVLVAAGTGTGRAAPIIGVAGEPADPLPQAFALTAIVISFGITAFLLSLAARRADDSADDLAGRVATDLREADADDPDSERDDEEEGMP